jgi:tetratricopeptide (TPR) repeat protein
MSKYNIDLAEAKTLWQALPTEIVPNRKSSDIPECSYFAQGMMPSAKTVFIGRDQELIDLARQLKKSHTCIIATGIGGVGKTTLASEFVYRYGGYFAGGVFWLSFADMQTVEGQIVECGRHLGLFSDEQLKTLDFSELCKLVYAEWKKPIPRLLVFDNCDGLKNQQCRSFLKQYLPESSECRVLITSRNSLWPRDEHGLQILALDTLERAESIKLLQHYRADLSYSDADQIADVLGDLPLALTLAGRYLADVADESYGQASVYLRNLRAKMLDHASTKTDEQGERSVEAAIALSYQRLNPEQDALAIELLQHASYFAPSQPFSKTWLQACIAGYDPNDETQGQQCKQALNRLLELGLLEQIAENQLRIHRLIANYSQHMLQDTRAQERVEAVLVSKTHSLANDGIPSRLSPILPHLYHCYGSIEQQDSVRNAELALALGRAEHEQNNYQQAEPLYQRALRINETALGAEHPNTAAALNNLASLYEAQGRYGEAVPLLVRALRINEQALGAEHPTTAAALNNLASVYDSQGRYDEAEPLYQRALRINETALGAEHPDTAAALNNLASVYDSQGRYGEAEPLYLRALRISEQVLGAEHPTTATALNNLAGLYEAQGRYGEAEPLYLRALRIREQVLGAEHPTTATALNNLAYLYKAQGRYGEAEPLYQRALRINETALGAEHPNTAAALNNLASVYDSQGRYGEAEPLYQRALRIYETALGAEHLSTATSLNNLAALYRSQGRYGEAEPLLVRALRINETALGAQHPDTQGVRRGLEFTQHLAKQLNQAQAAVQQALSNPSINRQALAQQITARAQHFAEGEKTGSPYYVLAEQLRALITQLDLENYTPPSEEQQIAEQLANAQALVERALSDSNINRRAVAQTLEQAIQQWESNGPESAWYAAAAQLREIIARLDLENYTPPSEEQQIERHLAQAEAAVEKALNNPGINRQELIQALEAYAQRAAEGQEAGSPLYVLAEQFRALAAQLRDA